MNTYKQKPESHLQNDTYAAGLQIDFMREESKMAGDSIGGGDSVSQHNNAKHS